MEALKLKGIKFYGIDKDNEIEIEKDGWSVWLSVNEIKSLIEFLTKQVEQDTVRVPPHFNKYL